MKTCPLRKNKSLNIYFFWNNWPIILLKIARSEYSLSLSGSVPKPIEETGWGKLGKQSGYNAGYSEGSQFIHPGSDWLD